MRSPLGERFFSIVHRMINFLSYKNALDRCPEHFTFIRERYGISHTIFVSDIGQHVLSSASVRGQIVQTRFSKFCQPVAALQGLKAQSFPEYFRQTEFQKDVRDNCSINLFGMPIVMSVYSLVLTSEKAARSMPLPLSIANLFLLNFCLIHLPSKVRTAGYSGQHTHEKGLRNAAKVRFSYFSVTVSFSEAAKPVKFWISLGIISFVAFPSATFSSASKLLSVSTRSVGFASFSNFRLSAIAF